MNQWLQEHIIGIVLALLSFIGAIAGGVFKLVEFLVSRELVRWEQDKAAAIRAQGELETRIVKSLEHLERMHARSEDRLRFLETHHVTPDTISELRESMMATFVNGQQRLESRIDRMDDKVTKLFEHIVGRTPR